MPSPTMALASSIAVAVASHGRWWYSAWACVAHRKDSPIDEVVNGLCTFSGGACACVFTFLALADEPGRVGLGRVVALVRVSRAGWFRRESRRAVP